jgi:integrase
VATVGEARELVAALPAEDQALWATAFFAGLRRGELRALRWEHVELERGVIKIQHGWDDKEGMIPPKYPSSVRTTPIAGVLRPFLTNHQTATGGSGTHFVFGAAHDRPFTPSNIRKRAATAWAAANKERPEPQLPLKPISLHECRHTCVTLWFEAGLSLELIGDYVGHTGADMTRLYRHLLEGHEVEATRKIDAYFALADTGARIAQLETPTDGKP